MNASRSALPIAFGITFWACGSRSDRSSGLTNGGTATSDSCTVPNTAQGPDVARTISTLADGQTKPSEIVLDSNNVYWVDNCNAVMKVPIGGTGQQALTFAGTCIGGLAVDSDNVYFTVSNSQLGAPLGRLPAADGSVQRVPISGGTPRILASGQDNPGSIAIDSSNAYWVNRGESYMPEGMDIPPVGFAGSVMKVALSGGDPVALASDRKYPGNRSRAENRVLVRR